MALRCIRLLRFVRSGNSINLCKFKSSMLSPPTTNKFDKATQYITEDNFVYLEDPNTFGNLSKESRNRKMILENEDDIKEEQYQTEVPLPTQKLTIKQYSDIIKQYLKHKRIKEAIDVLEVRMLTVDRVKPENYIYNILIGACADVGYTKKAFKLFNDMKRRALKPTGDTYTCLFHACANSPWVADGLKHAQHLRTLMIEKGIEPNLTNYNAMIKAFGRCGDLPTAFQIVDEMMSKKIKIRVHTFNHLLHACIADKTTGLRHALVVWRKMLKMREKPNVYSFNLMLKCVNDCNLGTKHDIEELIAILRGHIAIDPKQEEISQLGSSVTKYLESDSKKEVLQLNEPEFKIPLKCNSLGPVFQEQQHEIVVVDSASNITNDRFSKNLPVSKPRNTPNLLSKVVQMQEVLSLQEVHTVQDKFAVIGGQDDFLAEMDVYSVKPDIKTFTQMIPLLDNTLEAENKMLETMKALKLDADIDFYNILIKKRCLRSDYSAAFAVKDIIDEENKIRRKKYHPLNKRKKLKFNIMTYGVLALACRNKEDAVKLLNDMKENQLKVNIQILGSLLKAGAMEMQFDYVMYIMNNVKSEDLLVNEVFLKHIETFIEKCEQKIKLKPDHSTSKSPFVKVFKQFRQFYEHWVKEVNVEDALKAEHPWQQFKESYPETVQRSDFVIKEPKRFYKRKRKFVAPYKSRL